MKSDRIRRLLARGLSAAEIAKRLKVKAAYVHTIKWQDKRRQKAQPERSHNPKVVKAEKRMIKLAEGLYKKPPTRPSKLMKAIDQMNREMAAVRKLDAELLKPDLVNKPPHYTDGGVDTLKFIEAKDLNFRLGNVVKYISRAGKKLGADPVQDLEKARFYLEREIEARKNA